MTDHPKPPVKLGRAGRALWQAMAGRYELRPDEAAVLEQACRCADDCAAIAAALDGEPAMTVGSTGQPVAHPLRRELRETRLLMSRLLAQIDTPDGVGAWDNLSSAQRARKASRARWDRGA